MNITSASETLARAETTQEFKPCFIKENVPTLREGLDKPLSLEKQIMISLLFTPGS